MLNSCLKTSSKKSKPFTVLSSHLGAQLKGIEINFPSLTGRTTMPKIQLKIFFTPYFQINQMGNSIHQAAKNPNVLQIAAMEESNIL